MGIPGFEPYIRNKHSQKIEEFTDGEKVPCRIVDVLTLDSNPYAHNAWRAVLQLIEENSFFQDPKLENLTKSDIEELIFEEMFSQMMIDLARVKPTTGLFIAFDGPAPKAKQVQQRQRRFGSGMEILNKIFGDDGSDDKSSLLNDDEILDIILSTLSTSETPSIDDTDVNDESSSKWEEFVKSEGILHFNSNKITPGTPFSKRLSEWMIRRIQTEITKYDSSPLVEELYDSSTTLLKTLVIGFSDSSIPGEGEHKIMDFIRSGFNWEKFESNNLLSFLYTPPVFDFNKSRAQVSRVCIAGPDGDLLMLMICAIPYMISHIRKFKSKRNPKVYLYRRDHYSPGIFRIYDAYEILQEIWENEVRTSSREKIKTSMNIIPDFIYTGFSVGNDFVPKLKMFYHLRDGLDNILDILFEGIYPMLEAATDVPTTAGSSGTLCVLNRKLRYPVPQRSAVEALYGELRNREESFLSELRQVNLKLASSSSPIENELVDHTFLSSFDGENFNVEIYREKYYTKQLRVLKNSSSQTSFSSIDELARDMSRRYIRSLGWILMYYIVGINDAWDWEYGYSYPPLVQDLHEFISSVSNEEWIQLHTFKKSHPPTEFEAAVSVIPHVSSYLLLDDARDSSSCDRSRDSFASNKRIYDVYSSQKFIENSPLRIEFDKEGVGREYEKIALINGIDISLLKEVY